MKETRWLGFSWVTAIHDDQVREHGGSLGLRDKGLLESALARPVNLLGYEPETDLCGLAESMGLVSRGTIHLLMATSALHSSPCTSSWD